MKILLKSHSIGVWGGIRVEVAYSLYLVAGLIAFAGMRGSGWSLAVAFLLPLFVLIHEMGHSYMAMHFGLRVRRIVLHALGGVAELEGMMQAGPRAEIWIALAGPMASFFCAAGLAGAVYALGGAEVFWGLFGFGSIAVPGVLFLFVLLARMNLMLMLFNLLPVFPMDGGRVAAALAVLALGAERGLRAMQPVAQVGAGIVIAVGGMMAIGGSAGGILLIAIGFYLLLMGRQELQARQYAVRYGAADPYEVAMMRQEAEAASQGREAWSSPGGGFATPGTKDEGFLDRWRREGAAKRVARDRAEAAARNEEVDRILEKVNREGIGSLTPKERTTLQEASNAYRKP